MMESCGMHNLFIYHLPRKPQLLSMFNMHIVEIDLIVLLIKHFLLCVFEMDCFTKYDSTFTIAFENQLWKAWQEKNAMPNK